MSLMLVGGCEKKSQPVPPVDNRPPQVMTRADSLKSGDIIATDASVTVLDTSAGGSQLVEVRFDPPQRGGTIAIRPDEREVVLRDDGQGGDRTSQDGMFSATTPIDARSLVAENQRVATLTRDRRAALQFVGRVRTSAVAIPRDMLIESRRIQKNVRIPVVTLAAPDPNLVSRSLMVTDLDVVRDPIRTFNPCTGVGDASGKWTFSHLMTEMANESATGIAPSDFVRSWLAQWETDQSVNWCTDIGTGA